MTRESACPGCSRTLRIKEDQEGKRAKCSCGHVFTVSFDDPFFPAAGDEPGESSDRKEYKVLSQKDKWFSGKFDPESLERAINAYAAQGWTVRSMTTATIPGFGGNREELIVLLER